jgi:TIR domain
VRVFLSYRRGDAGGYAGRLTDALVQRLGPKSVFQDVTAISPGEDYTVAIDRALADSDAVLVIIGPGWLTAETPQGTRRLLEPGDYVRLELARALGRDIRVIPVLVGGARLPTAAELPDDLQGLALRQALVLHDETWHLDVDGLVRSLRGEPAGPARRRRRWLVIGTAAVVLLALSAGAWWWRSGNGGQTGSGNGLASCPSLDSDAWRNRLVLSKHPVAVDNRNPAQPLIFRVTDARWRADNGKWQVILAVGMKNAGPQTVYSSGNGDYRYLYLVVAQHHFYRMCYTRESDTVPSGAVDDEFIGFEVTCKPVPRHIELLLENGKINVTRDAQPGPC